MTRIVDHDLEAAVAEIRALREHDEQNEARIERETRLVAELIKKVDYLYDRGYHHDRMHERLTVLTGLCDVLRTANEVTLKDGIDRFLERAKYAAR